MLQLQFLRTVVFQNVIGTSGCLWEVNYCACWRYQEFQSMCVCEWIDVRGAEEYACEVATAGMSTKQTAFHANVV